MEYEDFYRKNIKDTISDYECDIFISAYNHSDRIESVYNKIKAEQKEYLLFDEYSINSIESSHTNIKNNKDLREYFKGINVDKNIVIDITGFIRPYLIYLIKILKHNKFKEISFIYSEPIKYKKAEDTAFSSGEIKIEVIDGFANETGTILEKNKILIIGAGFDLDLFNACIEKYNFKHNQKKILIGFPSLRPDMYQQNMLKIHELEKYSPNDFVYAPAHNPFITAQTIDNTVKQFKEKQYIENSGAGIYLTPLSTKAQVLGFALYAVKNDITDDEVTIFFPYSKKYSQETSEGIARIWMYKIDFSNL